MKWQQLHWTGNSPLRREGHRLLLLTDFPLVLLFWKCPCQQWQHEMIPVSPALLWYHMQTGSCKVFCLLVQPWRCRWVIAQGELDRATEGHQLSSRTSIWFLMREGTGGALPKPYKMTSTGILEHVSDRNTTWGWHECPAVFSRTCAHSTAPSSSIGDGLTTPELAG